MISQIIKALVSAAQNYKNERERERKLALIFALKIFFQQKWHAELMELFIIFLKFPDICKSLS